MIFLYSKIEQENGERMVLTSKLGRKYREVLITLLGLIVITPVLLGTSELPSNLKDRKEAEVQVNSFDRFDSSSSSSLDQLVNVPYEAVKRGEGEIGKNKVFREYGRNISNSIPVRDHFFVVGDRGIEIPMFVSNPTMFLNFMEDKYVPNFTLNNIVINGNGLYGIDIAKLDEDSPTYDPLESKLVKDGLLKSSDLDVILPYYDMSLDEILSNDIRCSSVLIDVSGLTGLDMTEARLNAISRYNFEAKKIASLELINDAKSNDDFAPKAFFWQPVSYDVNRQSVELLVGVMDLKMPEYANY